jgi:hypothetical protein
VSVPVFFALDNCIPFTLPLPNPEAAADEAFLLGEGSAAAADTGDTSRARSYDAGAP